MFARLCCLAFFLVPVALPVASAQADGAAEAVARALAEGRFADAETEAARAVAANESDAEAHYLLARVLYDPANPRRDERRASRAVSQALALQPGNLLYLVARLEALRRESSTFFGEMLLARQRATVARRILAVDSTNAFAHEELGTLAIRDYYQYRNAIALPGLAFADGTRADRPGTPSEALRQGETMEDRTAAVPTVTDDIADRLAATGSVAPADRFDVDALVAQGAATVTYERRARDAYREAVGHLQAALRRDPRRRSVYDHVFRLAAISGTWNDALPVAREMAVQYDREAATWLYLGLTLHRLGQATASEMAFEQALARMADDDRAAFDDLTLILAPSEVDAFRADPDAFARRYWTARDPRFLHPANERRNEHYARLVTADLLFRSPRLDLPGWHSERGRLFVRYGAPARDVVIDGGYQRVLEAFADRDAAFTPSFSGPEDANRFHVWDYGDLRLVFEDPNRNGEFRLYSPPADLYGVATAQRSVHRSDYVQIARQAVRERPERYDYAPAGRAVALPYRVAAFRGTGGRTDLVLAWGLPLAGDTAPDADLDLTIQTGAFLVGPDHALRYERRRTIHGLRAAQIVAFSGTRLWTSAETLPAPPGPHEVSLEFETATGGTAAVQRRAVVVPDLHAPGLQMSDILLAYAAEPSDGRPAPGRVVRGDVAVWAAPWGVFGATDPIALYVEVYGLALREGRTEYEVEARLVPRDTRGAIARGLSRLFGGRARGVGTAAEAQGDTPDDYQSLVVDARGQAPGVYTLTVTIRDRVAGRAVSRDVDVMLE